MKLSILEAKFYIINFSILNLAATTWNFSTKLLFMGGKLILAIWLNKEHTLIMFSLYWFFFHIIFPNNSLSSNHNQQLTITVYSSSISRSWTLLRLADFINVSKIENKSLIFNSFSLLLQIIARNTHARNLLIFDL